MTTTLEQVARSVEDRLQRQGLALTMGGEPTFIVAKPDGEEWNHDAMGPQKLGYARRLGKRLLDELYPGALVMQAQGKQYPGEPFPRWAVLLLHRDDGVPLWNDPTAFLLDDVPGSNTEADASELMRAVAESLQLDSHVLPCVEEGSTDAHRGWVLPMDWTERGWVSDRWPFSDDDPLILTPGASEIGLRLPLDQLDEGHLKRALTVEVDDGALHVFVPPLDREGFLALTEALQRVTSELGVRELVLCGYRPTDAQGITILGLAADPGVLEVNLPPTRCWEDYDLLLRKITTAAEAEGLHTTRYHLNGQIQGTGGGAHVLFGGPSLDENPFFERPDLLASMVRYWQWHPALSYFFSGQYVGPGSQAPRADETSSSRQYELELACFGVDSPQGVPDRVFLDRLFHNLMTDGSGNTHRAELCLDKLWNFDSPSGLQGLVELRAFETMPEVEMQSLAALFARGVVAMLAGTPRKGPLKRHGSRLHDAYTLPAFLWRDLGEICGELANAGIAFDREWLRPTFEHRFPLLGRLQSAAGEVLVRQALEPWPLMAEVGDGGTNSRLVDNSTDRIEISVMDGAAFAGGKVTVNGVTLRLRELDGALVGGVRYKCASGWPALHPHVASQSPIEIQVLNASGTVVAASRYHFWNPHSPVYEGRPTSLAEARARQAARWIEAPEKVGITCEPRDPFYAEESYYTLDLRRQMWRA